MIIQLHEAFDSEGLRIKTSFLGDHIFKTHHQLLELQAKTKWREEELEYKISYWRTVESPLYHQSLLISCVLFACIIYLIDNHVLFFLIK